MNQVQTLKGFRDFLPQEARKRQWLIGKIREVFERFGFEPLETPALEYESLLMGKYGDEADKLLYNFEDKGGRRVALRYDQTIPTARVTAQYGNDLVFPFKRYQIQPVWRADKPQKGRYREFTQCDVDILGSTSPLSDAEILACTYFSFTGIGYPHVRLFINDRQTLISTLEPFAIAGVDVFSIIQSVDKLDKVGKEGVVSELVKKGLTQEKAAQALANIQNADQTNNLKEIISYAIALGIAKEDIIFSPSLARGLDYYTGMIFEVKLEGYDVGSVGGGGRYDNLIEKLGGVNIPAVGIAFGFDRMKDAAEQFNLFEDISKNPTVLVTIFSLEQVSSSLAVTARLRKEQIPAEIFPSVEKLDKQLKYADKKGLEYVIIQGPDEVEKGLVMLKNLKTKDQRQVTLNEAINLLK